MNRGFLRALPSSLCAVALAFSSSLTQAQLAVPLLGIITPQKTTMSNITKVLLEKGCKFDLTPNADGTSGLRVAGGCFQLLADPTIYVRSEKVGEPVAGVLLQFDKGISRQDIRKYSEELKKAYGNPHFESRRQASAWYWPEKNFFIVFSLADAAQPRGISFVMHPMAAKFWQDIMDAAKAEKSKK
ncbi:MAG: hypothetical protein LUC43_02015 [Burkholderiales bacterium]|nr:hypothetical protein [Burkholderiales bacterium]